MTDAFRLTKTRSRRSKLLAAASLIVASSCISSAMAGDVPLLRTGDKIAMSITGFPVLGRTSTVDASGTLTLPLFGDIPAAGRDFSELRKDLRDQIAGKIYQERSTENGTNITTLESGDLFIELVERPPVYVVGDVSQPGERTFKPDMTVRQAVALSGGYDLMRLRKVDPFMESEDLRGEYQALWTSYAAQQAKVWRLEAQLDGKSAMKSDMPDVPVDDAVVKKVLVAEADLLKIDADRFAKQKQFLDDGIERIDGQLENLGQQYELQQKEVAAATADLKKVDTIQKGLIQATRLTDMRRAITLASTLSLQTNVEIQRSETAKASTMKERQDLDTARRSQVQADLRDARLELEKTKTHLSSVGAKLDYTSLVRSQLVRGEDSKPDVVIHRTDAEGVQQDVQADENAILQPGDVVDVALGKNSGFPVPQ
jgi:polysaccharide export outer membrane protein